MREVFEQTNVLGTENLLRAAVQAGSERFVYLSSIAVFGLPASHVVTDESPRAPSGDPYCDTKLAAEEAVSRFQHEGHLATTILRPSCVYGPNSTHWSVIPLKRIQKGRMLLFNGGSGLLNCAYIDNVVDAILLAAEDDRAIGQAFIVSDGATTWREYFGAYARMAEKGGIPSVPLWMA